MVRDTINTIDYKLPVAWSDPLWSIFMGFEHHRIHIESNSRPLSLPSHLLTHSLLQLPRC